MMKPEQIETATRNELTDELAAACEPTEDWETIGLEALRQQVRDLIAKYASNAIMLAEMIGTIRCETGNEFLIGSENIETVAQKWVNAGFNANTVTEWWRAGCFAADSTAHLRDAGLTPEQVAEDCLKFPGSSWGYAYCNSDVAIDVVRDATA